MQRTRAPLLTIAPAAGGVPALCEEIRAGKEGGQKDLAFGEGKIEEIAADLAAARSHEEIRAHIRARMEAAKRLPGFIFCLTGETPQDIATESLRVYFEACREYGRR